MARERDGRSRDLTHDRDRERDRNRPGNMTNHTSSSDPKLLMSRVFIGKLPTDRVTRGDLEDMFSKYGKILAISILRGYGFVQYGEESVAREACKMENGSLMKGNKLDVKMAFEGQRKTKDEAPPRREYPPPRREPPRRDVPPYERPYGRPPFERERDRSPLRDRDVYRHADMYEREPIVDPYVRPLLHPRDPYFEPRRREPFIPPEVSRPPLRHGMAERPAFDCVIIVTTPKLRGYAEMIERRLKSSALLSDHEITSDEKLLPKAVEDATRRGLLYAIILKEQNELHHSLTLNILHGTPQEHRNMPLDDAIVLIARNFEAYMLELREKATASVIAPVPVVPKKDFVPPDQHTVYLLNLLADSRFLTVEELDRVISYLQTRRHQLTEGAPTKAAGLMPEKAISSEQAVAQQQQELQKKILSILNGGENGQPQGAAFGVAAPSQQHMPSASSSQASTTINFDNPNVQAALDNLISSSPNLLKNITAVAGQPGASGDPAGRLPSKNYGVGPPGRGGPAYGGAYGNDVGRQFRY